MRINNPFFSEANETQRILIVLVFRHFKINLKITIRTICEEKNELNTKKQVNILEQFINRVKIQIQMD